MRPHGRDAVPSGATSPLPWAARPDFAPAVAVLMTSCLDPAGAARGYRTVLPRAQIWLYAWDMTPDDRAAAEATGAVVVLALGTALSMAVLSLAFGWAITRGPVLRRTLALAPAMGLLTLAFGCWYALGAVGAVPYVL